MTHSTIAQGHSEDIRLSSVEAYNRTMKDSVSVIIPAFNEEIDIEESVKTVLRLVSSCIDDFEVIVVNDGSTDNTGKIIARLAQKIKRIKVATHKRNLGFGQAFRSGINFATKNYITGFPADLDMTKKTLTDFVRARKKADIVSSYMTNLDKREFSRRIISVFFIRLMNLIFRLNLKYYNGYFISRRDLLKNLNLKSIGFTIFAEIKVKLIKRGASVLEIPFENRPRIHGVSKATTWNAVMQTINGVFMLVKDIYFLH